MSDNAQNIAADGVELIDFLYHRGRHVLPAVASIPGIGLVDAMSVLGQYRFQVVTLPEAGVS